MMAGRKSLIFPLVSLFIILSVLISAHGNRTLVTLNEDNWAEMLKGEWMVEFYAPWCPACKALQPVWENFSTWSADLGISVAKIDVTTSPGLSGRFLVTALPTIFHVLNGQFRQYRGGRDKDSLISFVEEKKWKDIEPIAWWKSPDSVQMSVVAYFFKLSTVLRSVHNMLVDEYGLPIWGSYLVFASATILIGALLGLLLVCVIDCIQPRTVRPSPNSPTYNFEGDEADDLIDEGAESGPESQPESQSEAEESQGLENDSQEESEVEDDVDVNSSPSVRKRRARKAD